MTESTEAATTKSSRTASSSAAGGSAVYFFAMIGSLVHYWQQADTGWEHFFAVLKAFVWPAFVVYDVLTYIN
ncbi:MAG: hypothetical protein CVT64_05225 [Actinobacteria bacterium HGW-Actinobacteria-4]|nr:MAG: hypothetical protein CVT64_05225 [Actinobacteria bacterium HGW-Actinobacteria-4]